MVTFKGAALLLMNQSGHRARQKESPDLQVLYSQPLKR